MRTFGYDRILTDSIFRDGVIQIVRNLVYFRSNYILKANFFVIYDQIAKIVWEIGF